MKLRFGSSRDAFVTVYADDVFSCLQLWKRQYQVSVEALLLGRGSTKTSIPRILKLFVILIDIKSTDHSHQSLERA